MASIKLHIRQKRIVYDTTISLTSFEGMLREDVEADNDPEALFIRKVEGLAEILGCSEAEAERVIFSRCNG